MVNFEYLYKGLCALATAHKASSLAGHLGAAVVAGYFFGEDRADLDDAVYAGIEGELDRIIQGEESFWFSAKKAGITSAELFEPLPEELAQPRSIAGLAEALAENIGGTRQSGHNVIFTAIAIRALHDHDEYATPSMMNGIRKLVSSFNGVTAGRGYYGAERGWRQGEQVTLPEDPEFPAYASEQEMVDRVLEELIRTASVRRQGFGGFWHIINHAAGLLELSRLGYEELARKGLAAHHHHVRLYRSLPNVESELGALSPSELHPDTPGYWSGELKRDEARLTHRIKTLYGFNILMQHVSDEDQRAMARESLLHLMA